MRIGIDATSIVGDKGGVGWHTHYLLQALLDLKEDAEYVAYLPVGSLKGGRLENWADNDRIRWIEVPRWRIAWRGRRDRLDLYHGPNFKMRTTGRHGGIVTIHDLWLERHPEFSQKLFGQRASSRRARATAHRARAVVTVSRFSADEIISLYGMSPEQVVVIHNGVSEDFRPVKDEQVMGRLSDRLEIPKAGFVLFVGGADPRKNHRTFLEAVSIAVPALRGRVVVLAGDMVHPFGDYRETAKQLGVASLIRCPGRMNREQLRLLYSYADLFVFPSLYEGFGMPVLEAMACGAPVITSNTSALPEVAGDAAVLVNPEDADALSRAIVDVLEDRGTRERLRELGLARAKSFTWHDAAVRTYALYRWLCDA